MIAQPETTVLFIAGGLFASLFVLAGWQKRLGKHNEIWDAIWNILKQNPNAPCPKTANGKHYFRRSCSYPITYCFGCDKVWLERELREAFYRRDASYFPPELMWVLTSGEWIELALYSLRVNPQHPEKPKSIVDEITKLLSGVRADLMPLPAYPLQR